MTISGNLRTMPLHDVLQWLANGRHTGTLVVTDGAVEKSLYLKDGAILSCTSSDPKEFLGHYLVSRGVIDESELAEAVAEQERSGGLLGTILVEQGAVAADKLEQTLKVKAQESIYELFSWVGGEFYFIDNVLPEYDIVPIAINVTPEQGFILSRIDGRIDVRSIVQISPLPEVDALLVLRGLIEAGHIGLEFR